MRPVWRPAGGGEAPGHGGGVVGEAEAAVGAEEDDAAVAAETVEKVGDGFAGGDFRGGSGGDAVGGPLAEDELHDGFAPAGEGDGGGEIVSVAAATDEGGVADAAGSLVEGATGGGGGGEVAADVEGDGADGVVGVETRAVGVCAFPVSESRHGAPIFVLDSERCTVVKAVSGLLSSWRIVAGEGVVGEAGGFAGFGMGEAFALAVEDQLGVVDEGHAVGVGKLLGAVADEVDMRALFEDQAGGLDGVAEALDAGHAAGLHAAAVHEEGIELDAAIGGEEAAAAGVEGGVVFEDGDGGFDGVESRAAAGKNGVAGFKRAADAGLVGGSGVGGDGPGAAVDEESGDVVEGEATGIW